MALLGLSSWCLVIVVWLSLAVPWVCLRFVVVVFPDHTHLLFLFQYMHQIVFTIKDRHMYSDRDLSTSGHVQQLSRSVVFLH